MNRVVLVGALAVGMAAGAFLGLLYVIAAAGEAWDAAQDDYWNHR